MAKMKYWNGTTWETLDAKDADTVDGKHATTTLTTTEKNDLAGAINEVKSSVDAHLADNVRHITSAERTTWNGKQDALGYTPVNKSGDEMTGILTAHSNTSYTVRQVRNIILSTANANVSAMQNGDIWIKYK